MLAEQRSHCQALASGFVWQNCAPPRCGAGVVELQAGSAAAFIHSGPVGRLWGQPSRRVGPGMWATVAALHGAAAKGGVEPALLCTWSH